MLIRSSNRNNGQRCTCFNAPPPPPRVNTFSKIITIIIRRGDGKAQVKIRYVCTHNYSGPAPVQRLSSIKFSENSVQFKIFSPRKQQSSSRWWPVWNVIKKCSRSANAPGKERSRKFYLGFSDVFLNNLEKCIIMKKKNCFRLKIFSGMDNYEQY